jgi:RNA polymerase sigma factor (sigma-70 family)
MTTTARSAAVLCKRVREDGDQAAFAEIVRRNRVAIRLTVREFRWAQETYGLERDELTQEVLLAFWEAACSFKDNWRATYTTFAKTYARTRLKNAVRVQQQTKYREQREAFRLDEPIAEDTETTFADQLAAPDYWQPEVIAEIRHDLRILGTELTRELSSTEREALTRVMLDEQLGGGTYWNAMTRVRRRAADCLGYEWRPLRGPAPAQRRERALELLADGHTVVEVARRVGVAKWTVIRWRRERPAVTAS